MSVISQSDRRRIYRVCASKRYASKICMVYANDRVVEHFQRMLMMTAEVHVIQRDRISIDMMLVDAKSCAARKTHTHTQPAISIRDDAKPLKWTD